MFTGTFSLEIAYTVERTHAAPPISPLMAVIPGVGFILIPPVSNVTPLPKMEKYWRLH